MVIAFSRHMRALLLLGSIWLSIGQEPQHRWNEGCLCELKPTQAAATSDLAMHAIFGQRFFRQSGRVAQFCPCSIETVQRLNSELIAPRLFPLLNRTYFRYVKMSLERPCAFWDDSHGTCSLRDCAVEACSEDEERRLEQCGEHHELGDVHMTDHSLVGLTLPWTDHLGEAASDGAEFVDLVDNPEQYTGYSAAAGASRIWEEVHAHNALQEGARRGDLPVEQRLFGRLLSGIHASVSSHIAANYLLDQRNGTWGLELDEYARRLADHPERLASLHFTYAERSGLEPSASQARASLCSGSRIFSSALPSGAKQRSREASRWKPRDASLAERELLRLLRYLAPPSRRAVLGGGRYLTVLRALELASSHLSENFAFSTGIPREDASVAREVRARAQCNGVGARASRSLRISSPASHAQVRELLSSQPEWPLTFDEQRAFVGVRCATNLVGNLAGGVEHAQCGAHGGAEQLAQRTELLGEYRNRLHNISKLMDCVGCGRCRLWGKLQVRSSSPVESRSRRPSPPRSSPRQQRLPPRAERAPASLGPTHGARSSAGARPCDRASHPLRARPAACAALATALRRRGPLQSGRPPLALRRGRARRRAASGRLWPLHVLASRLQSLRVAVALRRGRRGGRLGSTATLRGRLVYLTCTALDGVAYSFLRCSAAIGSRWVEASISGSGSARGVGKSWYG